ncbi:PQQ-binding-like beta-propeller repeat protein [Metaclostridioides mangenotii]|uniref:outer membrane protein assembly factor BamB family protein n=1 Tax=Metaclostridioides mangenotii TaxID=1540 RepID=UPI000487836B|nr:PQQ-binding-like beta-propeller repeat protein [Clostridioides mangenotii]
MSLDTGASLKEVVDKAEQIDADLQNKKQLIATAVTGKDVPTNGSDSFQKMADNIDSIKTKLPILEGDVGVTEDSEGNVYGVVDYEERHTYLEKDNLIYEVWKYGLSEVSKVFVDSQGFVYACSDYGNGQIVKLDSAGNLIWSYSLTYSNGIYVDSQGFVYCSSSDGGRGGFIKKLDPEGTLVWEYSLMYAQGFTVDSNGFVYVYQSGSTNYEKILKLDPDGALVWNKSQNYVKSILVDNGYIYVGTTSIAKSVIKLDSNGDSVWEYSITGGVYDIKYSIYENRIYACNNSSTIQIINTEGKKINNISVKGLNSPEINSLEIDRINNIYFRFGWGNSTSSIAKCDAKGVLLWKKEVGSSVRNLFMSNGFIYWGESSNVIKYKDNYALEKLAVLKEREVQ